MIWPMKLSSIWKSNSMVSAFGCLGSRPEARQRLACSERGAARPRAAGGDVAIPCGGARRAVNPLSLRAAQCVLRADPRGFDQFSPRGAWRAKPSTFLSG